MRQFLWFTLLILAFSIFAYARVIHGSHVSMGSLPDMRYFSQLYIPINLCAILLISPLMKKIPDYYNKSLIICLFIIAPVLILLDIILLPGGGSLQLFMVPVEKLLIIFLFGIILTLLLLKRKFEKSFCVFFSLILMIPYIYQIIFLLFFSHNKQNGYTFWLPIIEYIFSNVFLVIT